MKLNFGILHALLSVGGIFANSAVTTPAKQSPQFRGATAMRNYRAPNTNRKGREAERIPHGYPGAKLARKALEGKVGKAAIR